MKYFFYFIAYLAMNFLIYMVGLNPPDWLEAFIFIWFMCYFVILLIGMMTGKWDARSHMSDRIQYEWNQDGMFKMAFFPAIAVGIILLLPPLTIGIIFILFVLVGALILARRFN